MPANYTFTPVDAGVHVFTGVTLVTAGLQTITAIDTTTASIIGNAAVSVSAATAATFTVTGPSTATAGTGAPITVTAKDSFGNIATGYTGTVHFTSSDPLAILPADAGLAGGTGTFSIVLQDRGQPDSYCHRHGLDHANRHHGHDQCERCHCEPLYRDRSGERFFRDSVRLHGDGSGSIQQCRDEL